MSRLQIYGPFALLLVVLVLVAAVIAWRYGVDAERKPLEEIAPPLGTEGRDAACCQRRSLSKGG